MEDPIDQVRQEIRQWRLIHVRLLSLQHLYEQLLAGVAEVSHLATTADCPDAPIPGPGLDQ